MEATDWNLVGFVKRSKNRLKVLELLKSPMMPSELGKEMKISLTHASKIIRELDSKGLIACLNEELKLGRIYRVTKLGEKIIKTIKK
jgi:predicted transcriptional regulator